MQTRRGGLLDTLAVFGPDARMLQILPRSMSKALASGVILLAWERAFGSIADIPQLKPLSRSASEIPILPGELARGRAQHITDEVVGLIDRNGLSLDFLTFKRLRTSLKYFANRNIVWVAVHGRPRGLFTVSYRFRVPTRQVLPISPELRDFASDDRGWRQSLWRKVKVVIGLLSGNGAAEEYLRMAWGQPPNAIAIPVGLLHHAESYHLSVNMPRGTFCAQQALVEWNGDEESSPVKLVVPEGADYRGDKMVGSDYAHLYTYRLRGAVGRRVYALVEFRETPPGVTGVAYNLAATIAAFTTLVAFGFPVLLRLPEGSVDAAALLLAVPTLATVWILPGGREAAASYVQAPVVTRVAFLILAAVPVLQALTLVGTLGVVEMLGSELSLAESALPTVLAGALSALVWWALVKLADARRRASSEFGLLPDT